MSSFDLKKLLQDIKNYKSFKRAFPGTVISFVYKPSIQKIYDSIPVVLGIRIIGRHIIGCNIKLIPMRERIKIVEEMFKNKNKAEPKVVLNAILRGKYSKQLVACLEIYDIKDIKSQIKVLGEDNWLDFSLSNYNSFKNGNRAMINKIVKEKIKRIENPMKYMIAVIRNTIKRKK
jgi:hypothetical protein